jgi:hypothetical protein
MPKAAFLPSTRIIKIAFIFLLLLMSVASSAASSSAFSCACCADSGEWYERTAMMQQYEMNELRNIKLGPVGKLYMTEAGSEGMKGLPLDYASFNLLSNFFNPGRTTTLTFKGERGETGSLVLSLPRRATFFGADMYDHEEGSAGPILYKEWRLQGTVSGSGFFKKGIARRTKFRLILQGRGNNCLSSSDFKNWRLEITGPRASYAFYGSLSDSP